MADATVTIKLTPDEHRTICNALTVYVRTRKEQLEDTSIGPRARHEFKADVAKVEDVLKHI